MSTPATGERAPRRALGTTLALAALCDVIAVVVFAAVGRSSHDEHLGVAGVWDTAWPFLVGAAVGWLMSLFAGAAPDRVWPAGALIWVATVAIGMAIRFATGAGAALAFVVVATIATGVLLLGWRLLASVIRRVRS